MIAIRLRPLTLCGPAGSPASLAVVVPVPLVSVLQLLGSRSSAAPAPPTVIAAVLAAAAPPVLAPAAAELLVTGLRWASSTAPPSPPSTSTMSPSLSSELLSTFSLEDVIPDTGVCCVHEFPTTTNRNFKWVLVDWF